MLTYTIEKGDLISLNSELAIPIGTEMDVVNESYYYDVYVKESVSQPAASKDNMRSLTQRDGNSSEAYIVLGSDEIWVYSPNGRVTISVQEL